MKNRRNCELLTAVIPGKRGAEFDPYYYFPLLHNIPSSLSWNTGCQIAPLPYGKNSLPAWANRGALLMVAINLNCKGKFSFNGTCGYHRKHWTLLKDPYTFENLVDDSNASLLNPISNIHVTVRNITIFLLTKW